MRRRMLYFLTRILKLALLVCDDQVLSRLLFLSLVSKFFILASLHFFELCNIFSCSQDTQLRCRNIDGRGTNICTTRTPYLQQDQHPSECIECSRHSCDYPSLDTVMASMSTVMKNLYTFANILVQASTGAVSQWDMRSVTNAYNWATYCQKFYQVAKGKSFAVHLDRQIRSIALLLDPLGLLELNLERLEHATSLLTKKILGNPATTDKLTFYIVDKYRQAEDPQQIEELNKICRELSAEKNLKEDKQNETNETHEKQDYTVLVNTHAQILMECLHHQFLHTSDMVRFDKYLNDMLQRICKGQHGWNIILKFLMFGIPLEMSEAQMLHIEKGVLQFLFDSSNDRRLWESDAHILAQVSSRYPQIGRSYLNHLISWSRTLETVYGKTELGTFYEWRYTGNGSMLTAEDQGKDSSGRENHSKSFESLHKRFHILARSSVKTEDLVLETLTNLSQSSYFNIWRDLLKKLFIT